MIKQLTKLMIGSLMVYVATHLVRTYFLADVVPIGFEQEPQLAWRVQSAFVLLSVELIAIGLSCLSTIFIAAIVMFGRGGEEKIGALCRAKVTRRHSSEKTSGYGS
ncbi:MAG: hypothetical protein K2W78_07560 [Xanthobacteraceae bacterium]|nr:hypothetical protein [Xanthobacteraceae bacterium]